ncbi:uncharacterized protein LOC120842743 [Ixodes scapularis]|uniref:uncharacterized protein LOC120842743 n=1 Tax=Ixodes scapularis TaxID=6945 RepID=UPI001A9E4340|nr:uncharacterized protein LOC120842743 [Ixodes scapularis]
MQRDFAYVVVCTILSTQMSSPAGGGDAAYKGKADLLFEFLQSHEEGTVFYTIKRTYDSNLLPTQGKTETCVKATRISATANAAQLCTIFKTLGGTATDPFVVTYKKTGPETMVVEPGKYHMTVLYVDEEEKCLIVQHTGKTPVDEAMRSCDMVRASIDPTGRKCNDQFTRLCGSRTFAISTTDGCKEVPIPTCTEGSQPNTNAVLKSRFN